MKNAFVGSISGKSRFHAENWYICIATDISFNEEGENNLCRAPISHIFDSIASISAQGCGARNYKLKEDYSAIC